MAVVIDFSSLTGELHKVSETLVDQEAREELNPYLLNVILPMLMRGEYPMQSLYIAKTFYDHRWRICTITSQSPGMNWAGSKWRRWRAYLLTAAAISKVDAESWLIHMSQIELPTSSKTRS